MTRLLYAATVLLVLIAGASAACAQELSILDVDASRFPEMRARFLAINADGSIAQPAPRQITLVDNGVTVVDPEISCASSGSSVPLSSVLVVDISGSMDGGIRLAVARAGAHAWINALSPGRSQCAVTSFDDRNYLDLDFTYDHALLNAAVDNLVPKGGTDYNKGLLEPPAGGLQVSARGRHRRVIVFLTDGLPNSETRTADIIAEAQRQGCVIYVVTLGVHCPSSLREIAEKTEGEWFENVKSVEQITKIYRMLALREQNVGPCEATWRSDDLCTEGPRPVAVRWNGIEATGSYRADTSALALIRMTPGSMHIRPESIGATIDTTILVTATMGQRIYSITSSNPAFSITPSSFELRAGESLELSVSYTPVDSSYQWTRFDIEGDICRSAFDMSAGYSKSRSKENTLAVVRPNGGEVFVAGTDTLITWSGIPASDRVSIDYTTDDGVTWTGITGSATGGSYRWRIPRTPSPICRVRVVQQSASGQEGWVRSSGQGRYDRGNSVVIDAQGNSYVCGDFLDSMTLGTQKLTSAGSSDGYIAKYSPAGLLLWVVVVGGPNADGASGVVLDDGGDIVVVGNCGREARIGPLQTPANDFWQYTFVARLAPDGRIIWAKALGGSGGRPAIDINDQGAICVGGTFSGAQRDFGGIALTAVAQADLFLAKMAGDGSMLWARAFPGSRYKPGSNRINRIRFDRDQSIVVTGQFHDTMDFGGVMLAAAGSYDLFLARYTDQGDLTWARRAGGIWSDNSEGLAIDSSGSIYIGGGLRGPFLFDRISIPQDTGLQAFLAKYRPDGTVDWAVTMTSDHPALDRGGQQNPEFFFTVIGMVADGDGNLDVAGIFRGSVNLRGVLLTDSQSDVFVARFRSSDGTCLQARRAGGVRDYDAPADIALAPDGALFVTGLFGNTLGPALFDGDTIESIQRLPSGFHLFLWKIVASSLIQSDASDATFSIVVPQAAAQDMDMGRVMLGNTRDSLVTAFIRNTGSYRLVVDTVGIQGPGSSVFSIVSTAPYVVEPGASAPVEFRFRPVGVVTNTAKIFMVISGDTLWQTIRGQGIARSVVVVSDQIDFGQVFIGSSRDTLRAVTVTNRGSVPVTLTAIRHDGPNTVDFLTLSLVGAITLQPRDTMRLDLRFTPGSIGRTSGRIVFEFEGTGSPVEVLLYGEGVTTTPASGTLSATAISARAGEEIDLPILLREGINLQQSGATSIAGTLRFNASLLYPLGETPVGEIIDGERVILFELPLPVGADNLLGNLRFVALLGNDSTSAITLENVVPIGGDIALTSTSSEFRLLDLCYAGGARLFNPDGQTAILKLQTDASGLSTEVEIETVENGRIRLAVVDMLGREVMVLSDEEREAGRHLMTVDMRALSTGSYFLVLTTPTVRRVAPMRW